MKCHSIACICMFALGELLLTSAARAENRLSIDDATLPIGSSSNAVSIYLYADQDVYGLSLYIEFDPSRIRVAAVQPGAAVAAVGPDWADGTIDGAAGNLRYGIIFGISQPTVGSHLPSGARLEVLRLSVDVLVSAPSESILDLTRIEGSDPLRANVITDGNGLSIEPALDDGVLSFADLRPVIESLAGNAGVPGTVFQVSGLHFDRPQLAVTVCGQAAAAVLRDDDITLDVVAPPCAAGPAAVQICNDLGCDAESAGFVYHLPPVIEAISGNVGLPGRVFSIDGENFNEPGLVVRVCGVVASAALRAGGSIIDVTAPDCAPGLAAVEVCTDYGCDAEAAGFDYRPAPAITGYSGNSGPAGTVFSIIGDGFGEAGLRVRICEIAAAATLLGDGRTLRVTAPPCLPGPATVEVCTNFGCDSDPAGYTYPEIQGAPAIEGLSGNAGAAGDVFRIVGNGFDEPGLRVEVCGSPAAATLLGDDRTLEVAAPACSAFGPARVSVCTDFGCDVEDAGFYYERPFVRGNSNNDSGVDLSDGIFTLLFLFRGGVEPVCLRAADSDDSGTLDISDAVRIFNYLFLAGPAMPPPFPSCGFDRTPDLQPCDALIRQCSD
jgi:hypothetical protein